MSPNDPLAGLAWSHDLRPWASGVHAQNILDAQSGIREHAERYGVDVELLNAIVSVECGFNPTRLALGFNLSAWALRLSRAVDRFGDGDHAIAALLWGESNVDAWERQDVPIPAAARRHVDRVQRERIRFARSRWWRP